MDALTLARADTPHGEVALRRRGDVDELVVNGVFAMDSAEVSSELALADAASGRPGRVLVGGLGLGYTAARLVERGCTVDVVELAGPLVDWARAGLTPQLGRLARDPRVTLHTGDVVDWVATHTGSWDAICLDVDNGPSFLIHDHNARVYADAALAAFHERLTPGGVLLVWCEEPAPALADALRVLDPDAEEIGVPVTRSGRVFEYRLYRARR